MLLRSSGDTDEHDGAADDELMNDDDDTLMMTMVLMAELNEAPSPPCTSWPRVCQVAGGQEHFS